MTKNNKIKPMLAATLEIEDIALLEYPLYATYKLDGIRSLKLNDKVVTRTLKLLPNKHIRKELEQILIHGCDGEIMSGNTFQEGTSHIMSYNGTPDFTYYIFDLIDENNTLGYLDRIKNLKQFMDTNQDSRIVPVYPTQINNEIELLAFEKEALDKGYEGLILRKGDFKYKFGRSTFNEKGMLKLKRFKDSEAQILGFEALTVNLNSQTINELGYSERSTKKENLVEQDTLGTLVVKDIHSGVEFRIGSGFSHAQRKEIWDNRVKYLNKLVKYKFFDMSIKDAPRHPIWLGFRDKRDI